MEGDRQRNAHLAAKASQRVIKRQFDASRVAEEAWTAAYEQVWPPCQRKFPALAGAVPDPAISSRLAIPLAKGA